jgi:DNA-binding CsgD family transcriptional regulator
MQHLILLFHVLCFSSGIASIVVVVLVNGKIRRAVLRYYLAFLGIFTVFITINLLNVYRYSIMKDADTVLSLVNGIIFLILYSLIFAVVPHFFHALFEIEAGWRNVLFNGLAVAAFVGSYVPFFVAGDIPSQMTVIRFLLGKVYFIVVVSVVLYVVILSVLQLKRLVDPRIRKVLLSAVIMIVVFIPGFVADANYYQLQVVRHLLPFGLSFTSLFYLVWNILSIYYAFHFIVSPPPVSSEEVPPTVDPAELPAAFIRAFRLTPRETEVMKLLVRGVSNKEIAAAIRVKVGTVKNHVSNTYEKTGCTNRVELINLIQKYRS